MKDKDRLFVGKSYLEMFRSLCKAVDEAGGTPPSLEDVSNMTAWDLFNSGKNTPSACSGDELPFF